jgi:hypothetical protein
MEASSGGQAAAVLSDGSSLSTLALRGQEANGAAGSPGNPPAGERSSPSVAAAVPPGGLDERNTPPGVSALPVAEATAAPGFPAPRVAVLSDEQLAAALAQAETQARAGQVRAARDGLSDLYFAHHTTPAQRERLAAVLEPLATRLLATMEDSPEGPVHVVQPGDTLSKIAKHCKTSHEYLTRLNRLGRYIRAGQRIKLVRGPFDALVELSDYELTVLLGGKFIKRYRVGIGKDGSTPVDLFTVNLKLVNPTWYPPEGRPVPPEDPTNPLGTRWIGIGGAYGIHGTIEPQSIGQAESAGCIRLRNAEVEELYDMLVEGSRVLIRP